MTTASDPVESGPAQRSDLSPEPTGSSPNPAPEPDANNANTEGEAVIEADPNVDDGYASASNGGSTASTSISSSIRDYNFENRRRYHKFKEGSYFLPNDDIEQEREYMKHAMVMNLCDGRLHYAPLENPQKILDVGTGIGVWVIEMGDEYPNATVTGIDLSPIQPSWVPPNVQFYVEDAETDWIIDDNSLDYIHIRYMTAAIRDWPTFLARCYRALKPGGWIELQETKFSLQCDDNTLQDDNQTVEFLRVVSKGLAALNIDLLSMQHNLERVKNARFINAKERILKAPLGGWARDKTLRTVGLYNLAAWNDGLYGISIRPCTKGLGWSVADVELFLLGVRKSLHDKSQHVYTPFHIVTAQKPE